MAEWLSALQEAIRATTGRTLSVEPPRVAHDRFWAVKTFLLTALQCTVIFSLIPLVLNQRLPNRPSEWLPGPIAAVAMMAVLFAMRWWSRRSAIASGNLEAQLSKKVGTNLPDDSRSEAAQAWHSPDSGWGWLVGKIFAITFTSRLAYRFANCSALGFLGFLYALGYASPAMHWCFGFCGLFGLFGLIGVAHMIEAASRPNFTAGKLMVMTLVIAIALAFAIGIITACFTSTPASVPTESHPKKAQGAPVDPAPEVKAPVVSPAAELKALGGPWKVVRVEKGKEADSWWARICHIGLALDPATTDRLTFLGGP